MDANGDGALTADEISNHRADKMAKYAKSGKRGEARFKKLDTDGNGTLSKEEFDAGMSKHHAKRFQKRQARMMEHLDANKDGKITQDEMGTHLQDRMMARLDADGDGRISKKEMKSMRGKWRKGSQ